MRAGAVRGVVEALLEQTVELLDRGVLGLALGLWIDARWPGGISWTLTLLFGGLIVGCASAWYWLSFERRLIEEQEDEEEAGDGA